MVEKYEKMFKIQYAREAEESLNKMDKLLTEMSERAICHTKQMVPEVIVAASALHNTVHLTDGVPYGTLPLSYKYEPLRVICSCLIGHRLPTTIYKSLPFDDIKKATELISVYIDIVEIYLKVYSECEQVEEAEQKIEDAYNALHQHE